MEINIKIQSCVMENLLRDIINKNYESVKTFLVKSLLDTKLSSFVSSSSSNETSTNEDELKKYLQEPVSKILDNTEILRQTISMYMQKNFEGSDEKLKQFSEAYHVPENIVQILKDYIEEIKKEGKVDIFNFILRNNSLLNYIKETFNVTEERIRCFGNSDMFNFFISNL